GGRGGARAGNPAAGEREDAQRGDRERGADPPRDRQCVTAEGRDRVSDMLLMTPGPTRVPERVLAAGARPMIHHRTPEFSRQLVEALQLLQPLFGTREMVLPVHTTGRGAMEAVLCNLFSPRAEIAVCCNGKFGELWARFADSYGLVVHRVAADWAQDVAIAELTDVLSRHPRTRAVALAYCDTSTGVRNDVPAIARAAKQLGALVLVDCVSAL